MANYVEFVGIPGVGKTSTYDRLKAEIRLNRHFTVPEFHQERKSFQDSFKIYVKAILDPNKRKRKCNDWEVLERFFTQNPELLALYWDSFNATGKGNGKDVRFSTIQYILKIFEKVQKTLENTQNQLFIIDEGLIHNLYYFLNPTMKKDLDCQINETLDLLILPRGVVYFKGEISTVTRRTLERSKLNPRDEFLTPQELLESRSKSHVEKEKIITTLEQRGIPILYLECLESIPLKTQKIVSFLEELKV